jgi:hypothetical protein
MSLFLIPLGLLSLPVSKLRKSWVLFLLWGVIIYPLGGSLTNDGVPHATRTLIGSYFFTLLASAGFATLLEHTKRSGLLLKYGLATVVCLSLVITQIPYFVHYFVIYPVQAQGFWEYGHKEVLTEVKKLEKEYKRACLGNIYYWGYVQLTQYYLPHTSLQLIEVGDTYDPVCQTAQSIFVVPTTEYHPEGMRARVQTKGLDGQPLYTIYTNP